MPRIVGTVVCLLCTWLSTGSAHGRQSDLAAEWISANAIRLSGTEVGRGFADMTRC
jgi:hypothetical protein